MLRMRSHFTRLQVSWALGVYGVCISDPITSTAIALPRATSLWRGADCVLGVRAESPGWSILVDGIGLVRRRVDSSTRSSSATANVVRISAGCNARWISRIHRDGISSGGTGLGRRTRTYVSGALL